jgi:hypothetical protein
MQKLVLSLAACLLLIAPSVADAATGTAKGVNPDASAATGSETRTLVVGADIFIGDTVKTGPSGQVQIKFSDNTELVVGPRSSLLIEDYLLREDGSNGKLAVNALAGTFRFVTGNAPKDRYLITTPTGTIGVRGTSFDFTVTDAGNGAPAATSIMLYHGIVVACNNAGKCIVLDDVCEVGEYSLGDAVLIGNADDIKGKARDVMRGVFRYADDQGPLLREFRIDQSYRCLHKPNAEGGGADSLSEPGTGGQTGNRTPGGRGQGGGGGGGGVIFFNPAVGPGLR